MDREQLKATWHAAWPAALEKWSRFTMLREPMFFECDADAKPSGMQGEIAAIRLVDQTIMVNLQSIERIGLEDKPLEILAHEIGHHVYVPGNLNDNAKMFAAMRQPYSGMSDAIVHMLGNLYGDLFINDRLQRQGGLNIAGVYKKLKESADAQDGAPSEVWKVYTRAYEHLWRLKPETISPPGVSSEANGDAMLIASLIRHFAGDWLRGARRFAYIMYPYIAQDEAKKRPQTFVRLGLGDMRRPCSCSGAQGESEAIPDGLTGIDPSEIDGCEDFDEVLDGMGGDCEANSRDRTGRANRKPISQSNTAPDKEGKGTRGQFREPFQYRELLRALGLKLDDHEITARYYRERALPHLIPFPNKLAPRAKEPLAEGTENWEPGESLDNLDIFSSIMTSPEMIPGVTTVQRVYGETPGSDPARIPMDLDIYIDCSGSMPNPSVNVSYLALAGTILALSALRAGARVQATLWSGAGQFDTTKGFIRDEKKIMGIVTGYISGATAFPLHVLRDTYEERKAGDPPAHIVIISDDGVDTILANDEKGTKGEKVCAAALEAARGGATMVLNISYENWAPEQPLKKLGFAVHRVTDWTQLVSFSRAFVRRHYESQG